MQADGNILAGSVFTNIGGQTRNNIGRLDAVTGSADSFDPNATVGTGGVYSMAVQADGKILVGYSGGNIGGQFRNFIARLDAVTGLADSFDPNANLFVYSIAVQADGKILAGGAFSGANSIGGQTRSFFARLSNDTAALQNLAVTPTTITWTRGGSSPQFSRVTFGSSTDNVSYTPLGDGTPVGNNWTLTGLSLPSGQNFYIRARGYYRCSFLSASESITESVRNAFIAVSTPLQLTAAASRKTHGASGDFDLPLVLSPAGNGTVEPRANGPTAIVFGFSGDIVAADGMISSNEFTIVNATFSSAVISGSELTLDLSAVTDQSIVSVTLNGINDLDGNALSGDNDVEIRALVGDANQDRNVTIDDSRAVKAHGGQPLDQMSGNYLFDLDLNGVIAKKDGRVVRINRGHTVP